MEQKLRLFEEVLFEIKDGSTEQTFAPKHPKLRRVIFGLTNTFAYDAQTEMELLNSSVSIAWETLDKFLLPEGADWQSVIEGKDAHTLNRIVKVITTKLEHELPAIANPNTKRMYDPETGGKMYVTIDFESLDRPIYDENGEVMGTVGDDQTESFFAQTHTYEANPFLAWFRENRHEFLTRRQNEFIDGLSTGLLSKDSDYIDENDFESLAGMKPNELDHMKKRIRERTLKAWADKPETTRRGDYLTAQLAELKEFIAIADSDANLDDQNAQLSAWIKAHERESGHDVVELLYDRFVGDLKATRGFAEFMSGKVAILESSLLYRVYDVISAEIERLECEIDSLPSFKTTSAVDIQKRARNAERKRKYREFTQEQPCYVYREGELVGEIKADMKEYKVVELNAYGMTHDMREI